MNMDDFLKHESQCNYNGCRKLNRHPFLLYHNVKQCNHDQYTVLFYKHIRRIFTASSSVKDTLAFERRPVRLTC